MYGAGKAAKLIAEASDSWDLFKVEAPTTPRPGVRGRLVVRAKSLAIDGLKPVHRALVGAQRDFNGLLIETVNRLLAGEQLGNFQALQRAAEAPSYEPSLEFLVQSVLVRQRQWNRAAVALLEGSFVKPHLPLTRRHWLALNLRQQGSLLMPAQLRGAARVAYPVSVEFFRKQAAFNQSMGGALESLAGLPLVPDQGENYPDRLLAHERDRMEEVAQRVLALPVRPLISIVTPTWETPAPILRACLESVLAQSYSNWEMCLVDDGSKNPEVAAVLADFAARDPRIRFQLSGVNGGIAVGTNAALAMASGEFVGFLDHDDTLAPHALGEVVLHLAKHPRTDVLFSDEDRLDRSGKRLLPFFKPGWSPDLLRSANYLCHFLVARRSLIEQVGRIRPGFDGAQDFDFVLRLWERTENIGHIAEVLYHWRDTPQSTSMNVQNKPEAGRAGMRALAEHLVRRKEGAEVVSPAPTQYRARYPVPESTRVAVITAPRAAAAEWVARFASSRRKLYVVGNTPVAGARLVEWNGAHAPGAMYQHACAKVEADVYVFVDEDLEPLDEGSVDELVAQACRPQIGLAGGKLLYPDHTIRETGLWVGPDGKVIRPFQHMADDGDWSTIGNANYTRNFVALSGACVAVRREVIVGAGRGLGRDTLVVDLCRHVRAAGLRIVCTPFARFIHHGPEAEPPSGWSNDRDPHLNPNLSLESTNGGVRRR
jgi:GT2 family glycosyltransferase